VALRSNLKELTEIHGVGPAKATTILAAIRLVNGFIKSGTLKNGGDDPSIAASALSYDLMWQSPERFAVVMLDVEECHHGSKQGMVTIGTATRP
jgi:DNA repair protein RadC